MGDVWLFVALAATQKAVLSYVVGKRDTESAVALWVCFYNLCRVHETLRCTPATALGVTDHIWSVGELVQAALAPSDVPPLPTGPKTTLRSGYRPFKRYVVNAD
jgi:hypothetical protein